MRFRIIRAIAAGALFFTLAGEAAAEAVPMTPEHWTLEGEARFVQHDGRPAILLGPEPGRPLKSGAAGPKVAEFESGTIEFDVWVHGGRDFVQLSFRSKEAEGELFYLRPLQSGNPDSTQYAPVVNGNLAWQIFTGEGFTSAVTFHPGRWMRVRADIYASSAAVSIDGAPALIIPHLKCVRQPGGLALAAVGGAFVSNVSIAPIADYRDPRPIPPIPTLPEGSVTAWRVSPAMAEADALDRAGRGNWAGVDWRSIAAESNGIANLSRAGPEAEGRQTMIARFSLNSRTAHTAVLRFGFSDRARVFLNGRPLYEGADAQSSRDYRFLGTVGFWDTLFLPLKRGDNEITFVVSDGTNGGWAAAARIDPDPEVTVR